MPVDYYRAIDDIFSQFKGPKFTARYWNGVVKSYGRGAKNTFTISFDSSSTVKRLFSEGSIGFAEAYMDGSLRIEGDIQAYLRLRYRLKHITKSYSLVKASLASRLDTPKSRQDQIAYHYDLGNDFFSLFLDPKTMSYSAGRFIKGSETLSSAQNHKMELVDNWLNLPKKSKVLDLGSGWGGFAVYGAQKNGWYVTGYTYSQAQFKYCQTLVKNEGLVKQVKFEYRDMAKDLPNKTFDGIVMIESLEHVGEANLMSHFQNLYNRLAPGGSLYIQTSGQYKKRKADKFILKYVFPGGYLPTLGELITAASEAGFVVEQLRDDTNDYLKTLPKWITGIKKNQAVIENQYGESFYRLWYLWLNAVKVGFEENYVNLFRVKFTKA